MKKNFLLNNSYCFLHATFWSLITEQQHHGDDTAEIKLLKNRIRKLEQVQSRQSIKSK